jgi:hypothetical protein
VNWQTHEKYIAKLYQGEGTAGSGNGVRQKGDVRIETDDEIVECKYTDNKDGSGNPRLVKIMEKVASEAYEEGKDPAIAMRWFMPESTLANSEGCVDLVIRLARDDARRSEALRDE